MCICVCVHVCMRSLPSYLIFEQEVQSFYAGHPSKINLIPLDQFEKETVGAFQLIDSSNIVRLLLCSVDSFVDLLVVAPVSLV